MAGVTLTKTQERVFLDRYRLNQKELTVEQMWHRVAAWVSSAELPEKRNHWYEKFYSILQGFRYIPGGRINYAAGQDVAVTAHNCFVGESPEDSRQGILKSLGEEIETMAKGGGFGINMSTLRPRGAPVVSVNGTSSGPVPWMEMFSTASKDVVNQGGTRRGALMLVLDISHPDVLEFIGAKRTPGRLEGANISVGVTNAFMQAVENDEPWLFRWGGVTYPGYQAKEIWYDIAEAAWASGEPGVLFIDRCNDESNLYYRPDKQIICVNPCSEIPLPANGCCLLGTFNVERYVDDVFNAPRFDWDKLRSDIPIAVRLLDNVISISHYPLEGYKEHQLAVRQLANGITGFADACIRLGIRYGSAESQKFIGEVFRVIAEESYRTSIDLAVEKGEFPLCDRDKFIQSQFVQRLPKDIHEKILKFGIRNSYLVGQQPSGTGSLLAGVNSGIEPVFDFEATRKDRLGVWQPETVASKLFSRTNGEQLSDTFVSAHDLSPLDHIRVQAAAQQWCDQAISKTVNCEEGWTVNQVQEVFDSAWEHGLKSVAIYRDKSRQEQVLHKNGHTNNDVPSEDPANTIDGCRSGLCEL